ncbi:MAG: hypothetical protein ACRETL_01935 [Gammaproteobacteria bacterium]
MMHEVSNEQIYSALMGIKEDIGGLKKGAELNMKALENFGPRIGVLEGAHERQKGAIKVWGLIATAVATMTGAAVQFLRH